MPNSPKTNVKMCRTNNQNLPVSIKKNEHMGRMLGTEEGLKEVGSGEVGKAGLCLAPTNALNTDEPNYRWQKLCI
jgi:hypothetical protein